MLFEAQLHQLEALAKRRPVLMVFEDAHWIDPTSRELLDLTFDRVRLLPVLLIVTFRPEFRHAWGGQPQVTVLALTQLGGSERPRGAGRGTCRQCGSFPRDRRRDLERAAGVPLFVEELYKHKSFPVPPGSDAPTVTRCGFVQSASSRRSSAKGFLDGGLSVPLREADPRVTGNQTTPSQTGTPTSRPGC